MTVAPNDDSYDAKVNAELDFYGEPENVAELPAVYHFWSERYCLPLIQEVGFAGLDDFFDQHVAEQCVRLAPGSARLVSLGAGPADTELGIAERLRERGIENLDLVLLELSPQLLEHAMDKAQRRGLGDRVTCVQADLNTWRADGAADIYFANHSLHHLIALENLFAEVKASLDPSGVLLVNDMIGRNGHVRWPEAADLLNRIWSVTPERYRWNPLEQAPDDRYPDPDHSAFAFEGIRAQDILPLLLSSFHPDVYITFLNIADPFIDRIYGPNFDVDVPQDRAFIDAVGSFDQAALDLRLVTPTHLIASFRTQPTDCRYPRQRSPQRTLRPTTPSTEGAESAATTVEDDEGRASVNEPPRIAVDRELEEAWGRYQGLRRRRSVRAALALAELRGRIAAAIGSHRKRS